MKQLRENILDLVKKTKSDSKKESQQARYNLEYIFFPIFDCLCNIRESFGINKDNVIYIHDDIERFDNVHINEHWKKYATDWDYIYYDGMYEPDGEWLVFCSGGMYASIKLDFAVDDSMFEKFAAECRKKVEDKIKKLKKYEEDAEEKLRVDYKSIVFKYKNDLAEEVIQSNEQA